MAHGDSHIIPAELQEALYPIRIESFALRPDSGGAGQYRGGLGIVKQYRILAPCKLFANFDRVDCPPWGIRGGLGGRPGQVTVVRSDGATEVFYKSEGLALEPGDRICVETGGGGGYGEPALREASLIERDLIRGYISQENAQRDYGVRARSGAPATI